jgi:uncharacterized protein
MKKIFLKGIATKASDGKYRVLASTSAIDRQGDSIDQSGWDLANFLANPVILWAHDYSALPVGKSTDIRVTPDGLECEFEFAPAEGNPMAQQVKTLFEQGYLNAVSVGFIPKQRNGSVITMAELLEISVVPVPANQEALRLAMSKGLDVSLVAGAIEKGDVQDVIDADEIMDQKYENMCDVWEVMQALCEAYLADTASVDDFPKLLTETIAILTKVANGEEVEPSEGEAKAFDAFVAKRMGIEKAGRVISQKNRETISKCVSTMQGSVAVLEELLKATDSSDEGDSKTVAPAVDTDVKTVSFSSDELINMIKQNAKATDKSNELTLTLINSFLAKRK